MRLIDLEIQNIRGIRKLKLHPDGKNLVVLGPNGAGKSAVVDAIDFLLTGNISRLSGKGTAGITLKKHGRHIDAKPKDVWVKASVRLNGREFEITRCLAKEKELICPDEYRRKIDQIVQMAQLGHHVLTRREILRFVTAESGERGREIQALLNIQEIDKIRQAINSAASTIEGDLKTRKREEEQARNTVCLALGVQEFGTQIALEIINRWRAELGGSPIEHNPLHDLKRNLQPPGSTLQPSSVNLADINRHIQSLSDIFSDEAINLRLRQYDRLQEALNRVHENPRLLEDLKALELIQIGRSLLDKSGKCPLCQAEHPPGYLHDFLGQRLLHAREAEEIQTVIQEARGSLDQASANIRWILGDLLNAAKKADLATETAQIGQWIQKSKSFSAQVERDRETYRLSCPSGSYALMDLPREFPHKLEGIFAALESRFPAVSPELDAWDQLTKLEVHLQNLGRSSEALRRAQRCHVIAQMIKVRHDSARNEVLEKLYHEVCERFEELYKELHQEDERDFCAQLIPARGGIDFRVDFHGHGAHPPHALHSEGHQDSMGVCLFLALAERLTQGTLDLIVLDDVVMSVDIGHRRQLGDMLVKKFPHRQFLITTHDRVWATQLRNAGLVNTKGIVQFYGWDFASGPLLSEITNLWELIDLDLDRGDVSAAAAKLRRGLEEFSYHACDSLEAKVRFAMDGHWELGDLMPSAIEQYRYLLKKAKTAANSWNKVELKIALAAYEERVKDIIEQKDVYQWMINPSVHFNAWADLSPEEFRCVVAAHRELVNLFYCSLCGSLIFLVEENKNPTNVRCQCGEHNWNLVEKPQK